MPATCARIQRKKRRNPDDNAHAPNETMVLLNYETGLRTITRLWDDLGSMSPSTARMGGKTE